MFVLAMFLQTVPFPLTITLAEAQAMTPTALGERFLRDRVHGPIVDAIVNGRGFFPPSASVQTIYLVEQMVPYTETLCRSHSYRIEFAGTDKSKNLWLDAEPTQPSKFEENDRLWAPPTGKATRATCQSAPARTSGFGASRIGLPLAATLVEEARRAFEGKTGAFNLVCNSPEGKCGNSARNALARIRWFDLGVVEDVSDKANSTSRGARVAGKREAGPRFVQFTFPYAADGATWIITVERAPRIINVRMDAHMIIYH